MGNVCCREREDKYLVPMTKVSLLGYDDMVIHEFNNVKFTKSISKYNKTIIDFDVDYNSCIILSNEYLWSQPNIINTPRNHTKTTALFCKFINADTYIVQKQITTENKITNISAPDDVDMILQCHEIFEPIITVKIYNEDFFV